jgi:hypothetical protein
MLHSLRHGRRSARARPGQSSVVAWSLALACCLGWIATIGAQPLFAAVTSAALRGAGFGAQDGANAGRRIADAGERKRVTDALDKLATVPNTADCVKCLRAMLADDRLCKEAGTSGNGATTLPDKKAGCDPKKEAINLHPDFATWPLETLACVLVHEWCHTNQTDFSGGPAKYEKPCYELERDCLKALGQDKAGTPAKNRYDQIDCKVQELCKKELGRGRTPTSGARVRLHRGSNYAIYSSLVPDTFTGMPPGHQAVFGHPLRMTIPHDFAILEGVLGGKSIAQVVGRDARRDVGVLQTLVIENGRVLQELPEIGVPGAELFAIVHDRVRAVAYVLDTIGNRILRLTDSNADGVPDLLAPQPFADAVRFPLLANALALGLNTGASVPSLFVEDDDLREADVLVLDGARSVLFDDDQDGRADRVAAIAWRDLVAFAPGYVQKPIAGQNQVVVFAGAGARVEVQETDATGAQNLGVLGSATVPGGGNEVTVVLSGPLVLGKFIRTLDVDNPGLGSFPLEIEAADNSLVSWFGAPTASSIGTPGIAFAGAAVIGNGAAAVTATALPQGRPALLAIGVPAAQPLPLAPLGGVPGSFLLLDVIDAASLVPDGGGACAHALPIPLDPNLVGTEVSFQALALDPALGAVRLPIAHTAGMTVRVGG